MRKSMKKVTAAMMTAAMVASFAGSAAVPVAAEDDITIGVSIWSSTDVLGSQCKKIIDKAADALGVNVMYVDQGHVSEQVTASVEQLCAAGCDGIIICNSADSEMTSAIQTCDANSVYLTQFFRIISEENSPEVYQTACNSPYYLGAVHEDEVTNGYTLENSFWKTATATSVWKHGLLVMLHSSRDGLVTRKQLTNGTKQIQMIRQL